MIWEQPATNQEPGNRSPQSPRCSAEGQLASDSSAPASILPDYLPLASGISSVHFSVSVSVKKGSKFVPCDRPRNNVGCSSRSFF
ncbi:hypothetical protein U9M48_001672 [Paspalum notatum var. saurae]|uniref:Uncharacterized protein n=1 Tax=Paspalum notatum var. saurae TaxID=547442 RepID=A0AAQ3PPV5_PASNO